MTTISLELAKNLQSVCKEKDIKLPEHYWGWFYQEITESNILLPMFSNTLSEYLAPAYTLDELLEWLPKEIITKSNLIAELRIGYRKNVFGCWYEYADNDRTVLYSGEIVDSLCRLLIWTIKEGYLK